MWGLYFIRLPLVILAAVVQLGALAQDSQMCPSPCSCSCPTNITLLPNGSAVDVTPAPTNASTTTIPPAPSSDKVDPATLVLGIIFGTCVVIAAVYVLFVWPKRTLSQYRQLHLQEHLDSVKARETKFRNARQRPIEDSSRMSRSASLRNRRGEWEQMGGGNADGGSVGARYDDERPPMAEYSRQQDDDVIGVSDLRQRPSADALGDAEAGEEVYGAHPSSSDQQRYQPPAPPPEESGSSVPRQRTLSRREQNRWQEQEEDELRQLDPAPMEQEMDQLAPIGGSGRSHGIDLNLL